MHQEQQDSSLATLREIRTIMERSARLLSLSGWSGIWAGLVALTGSAIAYVRLQTAGPGSFEPSGYNPLDHTYARDITINNLLLLAVIVFLVALAGGYYFTYRKNKKQGISIWNSASRKMVISMMIPIAVAALLILVLLHNGDLDYITPICLILYGMALFNGSRYTISDIRYLGLLEIILGCVALFVSGWEWSLYLWAFGFGVLHILYGIIMWRKYDQQ